jgi:hypothetical protein
MLVIGYNITGTYIAHTAIIMPYLLAQPCKCKRHANNLGTVIAEGHGISSLGGGVGDFECV